MIEMSLQQSEPVVLPQPSPGRQVRSVAAYSLLTALMIITPMMVFVPAALFHCAIRNGRRAAWMTGALAVAIAALFLAAVSRTPVAMMTWVSLTGFALAVVLPSLVVLPLIERGEKFGRMLVLLLIGSAIGMAVTELGARAILAFSPFAAQVAEAQRTNAEFIALFRGTGVPTEGMEQSGPYTLFLLPGGLLITISLVFILSLLMFGRLNAWRERAAARGDNEALGAYLFRNFSLPDGLLFAFIFGGLTPLASGMLQRMAANTLAVVVFLYFLQGLAVFRFVLVAMSPGLLGSLLGWGLLLILCASRGAGFVLLGVVGLFDPFFDFRHFKKRKDDSHESHSD